MIPTSLKDCSIFFHDVLLSLLLIRQKHRVACSTFTVSYCIWKYLDKVRWSYQVKFVAFDLQYHRSLSNYIGGIKTETLEKKMRTSSLCRDIWDNVIAKFKEDTGLFVTHEVSRTTLGSRCSSLLAPLLWNHQLALVQAADTVYLRADLRPFFPIKLPVSSTLPPVNLRQAAEGTFSPV